MQIIHSYLNFLQQSKVGEVIPALLYQLSPIMMMAMDGPAGPQ